MKNVILFGLALIVSPASVFCGARHIAFQRDQAVWIANLDGTGEKKIAEGIFPTISPDGTRVAFNTVEKTSDTTYARQIAVIDVATGKIDIFKTFRAITPTTRAGRPTVNKSFSQRARMKCGTSQL